MIGLAIKDKCLTLNDLSVRSVVLLDVPTSVQEECEAFSSTDIACFQEDVLLASLHQFLVKGTPHAWGWTEPKQKAAQGLADFFKGRLNVLDLQKVYVRAEASISSCRKE